MKRRCFLKVSGGGVVGLSVAGGASRSGAAPTQKPNVLFIAVDDLNDWIEPLGGHPQAITPNLKRLAQHSVNFTKSYCASPACKPSRMALLTGLHTYTTGLYSNYQKWEEVILDPVTLPMYFSKNGYWTGGAGKIFHPGNLHRASWDEYYPSFKKDMPDFHMPNPGGTVNMPKFEGMYGSFDWAPIDVEDDETGDGKTVGWVTSQLQRSHDKPFFLGCGLYRPHLPWYVPKKYFDLFPLEEVRLPKRVDDDLADVGPRGQNIAHRAGDYHTKVLEAGQWKKAVQGYLASITFADAMVGRVLDALEASPYAKNTVVVLWSDHGWQLGEKQHWRKFALWENVLRSVCMMKVPPGISASVSAGSVDGDCVRPVSLLDIFPTLIDVCGLPEKDELDGRSLVPLLRNPTAKWEYPVLSTYDYSEFSVRSQRWRYTRYIDGSEELYDHDHDPDEWKNLANTPEFSEVKERLARSIPENPAPLKDTSMRLSPHHVPPFKNLEHYRSWKKEHP